MAAAGTISEALRGSAVVAAYLMGSRAHGTERPSSDTDVGVLLAAGVEPSFGLIGELTARLDAAGVREPDVHDLGEACLAFQAEAVLRGRLVHCADDEARVRFETYVTTRYLDFEPILRLQYRIQRQRIAAGGTLGPAGRR